MFDQWTRLSSGERRRSNGMAASTAMASPPRMRSCFGFPSGMPARVSRQGGGGLVLQFAAESFHDGRQTLHPGEPLEIAFDHGPGRDIGAGLDEHLLDGLGVGVPLLAVAPVFVGQLPALVGRLLALFEAAQLLVLA